MTLALTAGLFVLISAIDADATPIRPDIRKLVTQNQSTQTKASVARAGWNGPELPRREARTNPVLDPAVTLRSNKAALLTAAIPDPLAVLAIIIVIFLMRLLRKIQDREKQRANAAIPFHREERIAA
jgi:hypothetical protein